MVDEKDQEPSFWSPCSLFDLLLLLLFVVCGITALSYNARARAIPLFVCIIGFGIMAVQLMADSSASARAKLGFVAQRGFLGGQHGSDQSASAREETESTTESEERQGVGSFGRTKTLRMALWLIAFVLSLNVANYLVSVGLFLLFVLRIEMKESWRRASAVAGGTCLMFYVLFEVILQARL